MAILAALKSLHIGEVLKWAPEYAAELVRHRLDRFDSIHGTSTNSAVSAGDIDGLGDHQASGELYWPVRERPFARMMSALPINLRDFCFTDIGCGKGRALLLASTHPFAKIVGIEYSSWLCDLAKHNLQVFRAGKVLSCNDIEVQCEDATGYRFPDLPLVVFFFDPFGADVMRRVIENLNRSLQASPRPCFVIYQLPMHHKVIMDLGYSIVARQTRGLHLRYPWVILKPTAQGSD